MSSRQVVSCGEDQVSEKVSGLSIVLIISCAENLYLGFFTWHRYQLCKTVTSSSSPFFVSLSCLTYHNCTVDQHFMVHRALQTTAPGTHRRHCCSVNNCPKSSLKCPAQITPHEPARPYSRDADHFSCSYRPHVHHSYSTRICFCMVLFFHPQSAHAKSRWPEFRLFPRVYSRLPLPNPQSLF